MRFLRSLFMILIGMLSFTVTAANHSNQEQKQKTVVKSDIDCPIVLNVVSNDSADLLLVDLHPNAPNPILIEAGKRTVTISAIISDVGWLFQSQWLPITPYKEKLRKNYNLDIRKTPCPGNCCRSSC